MWQCLWICKYTQVIYTHVHIYISLLGQPTGPRTNHALVATSTLSAQILVSNINSTTGGTRISLEKWLMPRLEQGMYQMNLEQLVVPEGKEVLIKQTSTNAQ